MIRKLGGRHLKAKLQPASAKGAKPYAGILWLLLREKILWKTGVRLDIALMLCDS